MGRMKTCTLCGETKPFEDFTKHRQMRDGLSYWCKTCNNARTKAFRESPSGIYTSIKGRTKFYKKNYNIRYKPVNVSREDFVTWYKDEPKSCTYCGVSESQLKRLNGPHYNRVHRLTVDCIDNVVGYAIGNIVLACNRCNLIKSNVFTFEEMMEIGMEFLKPKWETELNQTASGEVKG